MIHGAQSGRRLVLLFAVLLSAGCGNGSPPVAEVEGVVKLSGKPLADVRVQFLPDPEKGTSGPVSTAVTDEHGHYQLLCADKRLGAVVGWHRVALYDTHVRLQRTSMRAQRDADISAAPPRPKAEHSRLPDKYSNAARTPLHFEVKPQKQEIDLDLTP